MIKKIARLKHSPFSLLMDKMLKLALCAEVKSITYYYRR